MLSSISIYSSEIYFKKRFIQHTFVLFMVTEINCIFYLYNSYNNFTVWVGIFSIKSEKLWQPLLALDGI